MLVNPDYVKLSELDFLAENRPLNNICLEDKSLNDTTYRRVTKNGTNRFQFCFRVTGLIELSWVSKFKFS